MSCYNIVHILYVNTWNEIVNIYKMELSLNSVIEKNNRAISQVCLIVVSRMTDSKIDTVFPHFIDGKLAAVSPSAVNRMLIT